MNDTRVTGRSVRIAFGVTIFVALLPVAIAVANSGAASRTIRDLLGESHGLSAGSGVALALILAALVCLAIYVGRRVVRRPFRA